MSVRNTLFLTVLTVLVLSGCGKAPAPLREEEHRAPIKGALLPLTQKFRGGPGFGPCETKNYEKMLEITRELDARAESINEYARTRTNASKFTRIQVGPISVRNDAPSAEVKTGWNVDHHSWSAIIAEFEKARVSGDPDDWHWLNVDARSILAEDEDRVVGGYAYDIGHEDEAPMNRIREAVNACWQRPACSRPEFGAAERAWMASRPSFVSALAKMEEDDSATRQKAMSEIYSLTGRFAMRENDSVSRNGSELVLPLFAGPFASVQSQVAEYIESVWKSDRLHLKIDWREAPSSSIYELLVAPGTSGRSWVNWQKQQVNYFTDMRQSAFAHEIGHVLGFRDHYYMRWNEANCEYSDEYRMDDLMSDSGPVLDTEWDILDATYPSTAGR